MDGDCMIVSLLKFPTFLIEGRNHKLSYEMILVVNNVVKILCRFCNGNANILHERRVIKSQLILINCHKIQMGEQRIVSEYVFENSFPGEGLERSLLKT